MRSNAVGWLLKVLFGLVLVGAILMFVKLPFLFECSTKYRTLHEVDWQTVRSTLAEILNRRKAIGARVYNRKLVSEDIALEINWEVERRMGAFEEPFQRFSFKFGVPEHEKKITGVVDRCGFVDALR